MTTSTLRKGAKLESTDGLMAENMPSPIKRVCRCLGYVLLLGTPDAWQGLQVVLSVRLSSACRILLAANVLATLNRDDAIEAFGAAHTSTCAPIPPFLGVMDEAAFWADMAAPEELEAYSLACFNRMPQARQDAFLEFVRRRDAA